MKNNWLKLKQKAAPTFVLSNNQFVFNSSLKNSYLSCNSNTFVTFGSF